MITKKGNSIYLLTYLDGGGGRYILLSQVARGILDGGGGTSTPCMSSVQDLPEKESNKDYP